MIKITFLDVGQGDSIIMEWTNGAENCIGIIDSNIFEGENRVVNFLERKAYKCIKFIILSHPHFDHYSGLSQVIDFCFKSDITIEAFLFTSYQIPEYLKIATRSKYAEKALFELFVNIDKNRKTGLIQKVTYLNSDCRNVNLNNDLFFRVLAPSTQDLEKYLSTSDMFSSEEDMHNNPNGNLLSTVLKIQYREWFLLLTSDAEKSVLKRIGIKEKTNLEGRIVLGQVPHHGSKLNHSRSFWKNMNQLSDVHMAISVGPNKYNHPSSEVLTALGKSGFIVSCTGIYHKINKGDSSTDSLKHSLDLHSWSPKVGEYRFNDLEYFVDSEGVVTMNKTQ